MRVSGSLRLGLVGLVAALVALTACSNATTNGSGNPSSTTGPATGKPARPQPKTGWQKTLGQVRPDGTVTTTTALNAFAEAIGPVPGVTPPSGPTGPIESGTIAVRWVLAHWKELTPQQQAAVQTDLGGPAATHHFTGTEATPSPGSGTNTDDPDIPCQTQNGPGTKAYQAELNGIVSTLEAHLWPLRIRDHVFFVDNTKLINPNNPASDGKDTAAYTVGCTGANEALGTPAGCTIHVNPGQAASTIHDLLIHEMTHCFMMQHWGVSDYARMPNWFVEGGAEWVVSSVGDGDQVNLGFWHNYLDVSGLSLDRLTYDGMGFFVHLAETGADPWKLMEPMGDAMMGGGGTLAGWNAAKPNQQFLDSWGSGFAQGHYPGRDWETTGPHLDHYSPPLVQVENVNNNDTVPIGTVPFAADLRKLQVNADVMQVSNLGSSTVSGLLSLGGGQQTKLPDTANVNYCTLSADKCHCPKDSPQADTQFTHMDPGAEWVGLTGGPDAAHITVHGQSMDDFCNNASKLVGTWKTTSVTGHTEYRGESEDSHGGAGITLTIDRTGKVVASYDGMAGVDFTTHNREHIPVTGSATWTGTQDGTQLLPDRKATHGTWDPLPNTDSVAVTETVVAPAQYAGTSKRTLAELLAARRTGHMDGAINKGTWSITGKTLTLSVTLHGQFTSATGTWILTRVKQR